MPRHHAVLDMRVADTELERGAGSGRGDLHGGCAAGEVKAPVGLSVHLFEQDVRPNEGQLGDFDAVLQQGGDRQLDCDALGPGHVGAASAGQVGKLDVSGFDCRPERAAEPHVTVHTERAPSRLLYSDDQRWLKRVRVEHNDRNRECDGR